MKRIVALALLLHGVLAVQLCAQQTAQPADSKGKDFWFAFLPNIHNDDNEIDNNPFLRIQHQLYVYVVASEPTTGTISFRDANGIVTDVPFTITDPSKIYSYSRLFRDIELEGYNRRGNIGGSDATLRQVKPNHVHVTASKDVSVYALNQAYKTSDAFMVLPTDALGLDYCIMSYRTSRNLAPGGTTPSQFAVVATEDSTEITILPSVAITPDTEVLPRVVTLDQGESYLVQAERSVPGRSDVTGSIVRSNKPVAVFGGHQRALLPLEAADSLSSRDHLIEQMNPIATWGRRSFITPLAIPSKENGNGYDIFRVVSAFDSTNVFVAEELVAVLQKGEFYEGRVDGAKEVRTSRPTLTAQFKKSSTGQLQDKEELGDPLMMLVTPPEQFMDSYRFITIQAVLPVLGPFGNIIENTVYVEQYLNVVIPTSAIPSLILDGKPVSAREFLPIGSTLYSYATLKMADGAHDISASDPFGIYVYGYGVANSYGYIGGMAFRVLDVNAPVVSTISACGGATGIATDSLLGDSKLAVWEVVPGTEQNVTVGMPAPGSSRPILNFAISLIDKYRDGEVTIRIEDNSELVTTTRLFIPGFTVNVVGQGATPLLKEEGVVLPLRNQRCDTVYLENYGGYTQTISNLRFKNGLAIQPISLPLILPAGSRYPVVFCPQYPDKGIYYDTLIIEDSCLKRPVLAQLIDVRNDEILPSIEKNTSDCDTARVLQISELDPADSGLETVVIDQGSLINCTANIEELGVLRSRIRVGVLDPFQDAFYTVIARDSMMNTLTFTDTIPGFTVSIGSVRGSQRKINLGEVLLTQRGCYSIALQNYGVTTKTFSHVYITGNIRFSLPQSQFPIILNPGEEKNLEVCYEPGIRSETSDTDSLIFPFECTPVICAVSAEAKEVVLTGNSRCSVPVETKVGSINKLLVAPLPALDMLTVVAPQAGTNITVELLTINGIRVFSETYSGNKTNALELNVSDVAPGVYVCTWVDNHQSFTSMVHIY